MCKNYPCKNGGVCNVQNNKPECWCLKGTIGTNCEHKNYGTLIVYYFKLFFSSYSFIVFWSGATSCRYTLCFNGGLCVERQYGTSTMAYCLCKSGFAGSSCDAGKFKV